MQNEDWKVSLSPKETLDILEKELDKFTCAKCLDRYAIQTQQGAEVEMAVFEQYYMRTSNRATLTVLVNAVDGVTNVHFVAGGSSNNMFFRFDWGASEDFVNWAKEALKTYRLE